MDGRERVTEGEHHRMRLAVAIAICTALWLVPCYCAWRRAK